MKTSDAERNGFVCPVCRKRLAGDRKKRGFVHHVERKDDGTICENGPTGERDPRD